MKRIEIMVRLSVLLNSNRIAFHLYILLFTVTSDAVSFNKNLLKSKLETVAR